MKDYEELIPPDKDTVDTMINDLLQDLYLDFGLSKGTIIQLIELS